MTFLVALLSLALVTASLMVMRERRQRRGLQSLLNRVLHRESFFRDEVNENMFRPGHGARAHSLGRQPHSGQAHSGQAHSGQTHLAKLTQITLPATLLAATLILGCGGGAGGGHRLSEDEWHQLFGMPAETTKAASELVQKDAESRRHWLSLQADLQAERSEIGRQRDLLEEDRRDWFARERNDSPVAAAIHAVGLLAACSLPLILVALLLWPRRADPGDDRDLVSEILIDDLVLKQSHAWNPEDHGDANRGMRVRRSGSETITSRLQQDQLISAPAWPGFRHGLASRP